MTHFRNRNDVIEWAEKNLPKQYVSVARAFREGSIEFLGGFSYVLNYTYSGSGWIIKIESKFKKTYYVAVTFCYMKLGCYVIDNVPWKYWDGDKSANPLYQGDNPEEYRRLKNDCEK